MTLYLVPLPPYKQPKLSFGCSLDAAGLSGIAFWKQKLVRSLISIKMSLILQTLQNQLLYARHPLVSILFTRFLKSKNVFSRGAPRQKGLFLEILALCTVSIQEWFLINSVGPQAQFSPSTVAECSALKNFGLQLQDKKMSN